MNSSVPLKIVENTTPQVRTPYSVTPKGSATDLLASLDKPGVDPVSSFQNIKKTASEDEIVSGLQELKVGKVTEVTELTEDQREDNASKQG